MSEVMLKTHLICTKVSDEYEIKWCGKLVDARPLLKNGWPIFIIVGTDGRMELNTIDIKTIEHCAKSLSHPRGREAITSDCARIYLLEEDGNERLMGKVFHNHVKQYQQMYDKFEYIWLLVKITL